MDKSRAGFSFRKSMRGFNKDDVVQYISEENKRFMQEKTAIEEKLSEAEWHIADMARKLEEQKEYFENLLKEKEEELNAAKESAAAAGNLLSEAEAKASEVSAENERLHALVKGCEEQLSQYSERITEFEVAFAAQQADKQECERVKSENEYIREKYKSLESEFQILSAKARTAESAPSILSTPRESHEDPFQRTRPNNSASKIGYHTQSSAFSNSPKSSASEGRSADKANSEEVSNKAITAILAINNDVKKYMTDCVSEFDSYSRDISDSLSKLADDISTRCKVLSDTIKYHKDSVSENIDSIYGGFNHDKE